MLFIVLLPELSRGQLSVSSKKKKKKKKKKGLKCACVYVCGIGASLSLQSSYREGSMPHIYIHTYAHFSLFLQIWEGASLEGLHKAPAKLLKRGA